MRLTTALSVTVLLLVSGPSLVKLPVAMADGIILSPDDGQDSSTPQIAVSGSDVHVVWRDSSEGNDDIFVASSSDDGQTFSDPVNISNSIGSSSNPQVAASGSGVHVVWQDDSSGDTEILIASSSDDGETFSDPVNISNSSGSSSNPQVAASGSSVHVVWQDAAPGNNDILLASASNGSSFSESVNVSDNTGSSTNPRLGASGSSVHVVWQDLTPGNSEILSISSADGGATLGDVLNLSSNDLSSTLPEIAVSDSNVHVVWQDTTPGNAEILSASSSDDGANFSAPTNVSNNDAASNSPQVAVSTEGDVYALWSDKELGDSNPEIFLSVSNDSGSTFGTPVNLSANSDASLAPQAALAGDGINLHITWHDLTPGVFEVMLAANISPEGPSIVINPINNTDLKWGSFDPAELSGTVGNAAQGDKVLIEWGDESSDEVAITGSSWGPVSHGYGALSIGNNTIVARLLASDDTEKAASSPVQVNVQKHEVDLALNSIASVRQGLDVTAGGVLTDADTDEPIAGMTITFDGSGADILPAASTDSSGAFVSTGASANSTEEGLTVQAHFNGTALYGPADSQVRSYDLIGLDSEEFEVSAGSNSTVILTGFDATVVFEKVVSAGSIFVSECVAEDNSVFLPLDSGCINISSGLQTEEGTSAEITISYANSTIPEGHSENEIHLFHLTSGDDTASIDITSSRDPDDETVSGLTQTFSEFVLAIPIYGDPAPGAHRTEVFVGDDNVVSLRNVTNQGPASFTISFDRDSYTASQDPTITIADSDANADPGRTDIVHAGVMSETSNPVIVSLTLSEGSANSGSFEGSFGFTSGESNTLGGPLQAADGDELSVFYIPGARFEAEIDGVVESGLVELSDYVVEQDVCFDSVGGGVNLEFVGAELGADGKVRATISYANANLTGADPDSLRVLHREDATWIDITLPAGAHDSDAKTVTGEASSSGPFTLGTNFEQGCVGGAGGGFGRGLVVDAVASIAKSSSSDSGGGNGGSGGGGGGGRSAPPVYSSETQMIQSGQQVTVSEDLPPGSGYLGGRVTINFENVVTPGTINIDEQLLSATQNAFTTVESEHGSFQSADGASFSTAGPIFNITPSGVQFEGTVDVTIPYSEVLVSSSFGVEGTGSEENIRFLHFDGTNWQDLTVNIDQIANTVTGRISSFSTVVAAVVEDGTFGSQYFVENPMKRLLPESLPVNIGALPDGNGAAEIMFADPQGNPVTAISDGQDVTIVTAIKNPQRVDQEYVYLMEVFDSKGIVIEIDMLDGTLGAGQSDTIQNTSFRAEGGEQSAYTIKVFLLTGVENPELLAEVLEAQLPVVSE